MSAIRARSIDELICNLNEIREDVTPGGVVRDDVCVNWIKVGMIVWQVRETRFMGSLIYVRIVCNVIVKAVGEFAAVPLHACDELDHCTCPLEFLAKVPTRANDKVWRDRVWAWHEQQLTTEIERSATKATSWVMRTSKSV